MTRYCYVLGVPNFANYESSASLIRVPLDGGTVDYVSIAEERLNRVKHSYAFPLRAIHHCLAAFGLESLEQVDYICTDHAREPRWIDSGPGYRKLEHDYLKIRLKFPRERILVVDHHDAHAASAFYPSPFDEAAVLVVDSLGSRLNTQTLYHFSRAGVRVMERGDSWGIGRLYSLVTGSVLPYGPEKGFGKTMGLAPYGRDYPGPVLDFGARDNGMETDYSAFCTRAPVPRIVADGVRRCQDRQQVLDPYFARAAYDVQEECERQMVRMAAYAATLVDSPNLCIAGGVALNGLANARVLERTAFERVFIPPGCSDTGLSLGLALWGYFQEVDRDAASRVSVSMQTAYTGRPYPPEASRALLDAYGVSGRSVEPRDVAPLIASGKVVAWFEGGSEFGPRALGHRSILADPRDPRMKDTINQRVKFREPYRPYAPSILAEHASQWLQLDAPSPFMLLVVQVREDKQALVPAITHVDGTTRPQTVTPAASPRYYALIREFHRLTGVPMVLNTSLNINREPIVETPIDALICAFGTSIDFLYLDGVLVDCGPYRDPELVKRLLAHRARILDEEWALVTSRYLTSYDTDERDRYITEASAVAEWHRQYRAKYEIERAVRSWLTAGARVVIVGTRGHTRCLREYIDGFSSLVVAAFVPMDERPGEPGTCASYAESALDRLEWRDVDAVLISTHEYQAQAAAAVQACAPPGMAVVVPYDAAGDSLLHVLPGRWPVLAAEAALPNPVTRPTVTFVNGADWRQPARNASTHRHALIVNYHYCHPSGGFLDGTKAVDPVQFGRQLRALKQNFTCTTIAELMNPASNLPETVAVVTFDDGLKDVIEHALPQLQRWDVPATVFCSSGPLLDHTVLNVHRAHLLQARLGVGRFRTHVEEALATVPLDTLRAPDGLDLAGLYRYDDEETRRFKILLNFLLPPRTLAGILRTLTERFIGDDEAIVPRLYLSRDDVHRCQDAGIDIALHGHGHLVYAALSEAEQREDLEVSAGYFRQEFGLRDLHMSYPYGAPGCWNDVTRRLVEGLGYASAATTIRAIVTPSDIESRWQLPRFDVRDVFDAQDMLLAEPFLPLFSGD